MRCVVLGAGGMGVAAAKTVARVPAVTDMIIADLDAAAAERLAQACGTKACAVQIDVTDRPALDALLAPADVMLNLVGPFFRFAMPVLDAAIATRTPYFDICDDPEPTMAMLGCDQAARTAGIPAVIGLGASPGLTNLLAVKAAAVLDQVDEVVTGWNADTAADTGDATHSDDNPVMADGRPSAAVVHWMEQCSGSVMAWDHGALTPMRPVEPEKIVYPGIGTRTVWTVGHPEAITLPRTITGVRRSVNVMVLSRFAAMGIRSLRNRIDSGALSVDDAARAIAQDLTQPGLISQLFEVVMRPFNGPSFPPLFAIARGQKDGLTKTVAAHMTALPPGGMAGATGVPLAVGLQLFAEGAVLPSGVIAPEAAFDPDLFFTALAPFCGAGLHRADDIVTLAID